MVPQGRIELPTSSLPMSSTTELLRQISDIKPGTYLVSVLFE